MPIIGTIASVSAKGYGWAGCNTAPVGQQEYTTPGIYTFIVPVRTSRLSVVAVGGGGGGANTYYDCATYHHGGGGGGGGLAYKNNITVYPGQSISIVVGTGGNGAVNVGCFTIGNNGCSGGDSSFGSCFSAKGGGGGHVTSATTTGGAGGQYSGSVDGYGYGGCGGNGNTSSTEGHGGGGGAGGYSGKGGNGGGVSINTPGQAAAACSGGASGGSSEYAYSSTWFAAAGGGGVGILGKGATGIGTCTPSYPCNPISFGGKGGSGGNNANNLTCINCVGNGAGYGGGGGANYYNRTGGNGANGAVRIIWPGNKRSFPSTCTGNL